MLYILLSCLSLAMAGSAYTTSHIKQRVDEFINKGLSEVTCIEQSAVALSIIKDGKVVMAETYGLRNQEEDIAADAHTLFGIGSTTKALTAIVVNKVLETKGYNWTTPIKSFYPRLKLPGANRTNLVTYEDLFSHHICLTRDDFIWMAGPQRFSMEDLIDKLQFFDEKCEFRTEFIYNNLMFVLGAFIAEEISGRKWADLVTEYILVPNNMTETKLSWTDAYETGNVAQGYQYWEGKMYPVPVDADKMIDIVAPAGSVHSTPTDMAKYMNYLINNYDYYKDLFWSPRVNIGHHLGVTGSMKRPPYPAEQYYGNYSIAWLLGNYNKQNLLFHGGDTFASHTLITIDHDERTGIYVSCTGSVFKARQANQLITWFAQDFLLGNEPWLNHTTYCTYPAPWDNASTPDFKDNEYVNYESVNGTQLEELAGVFGHKAYGNITLENRDKGLFFQYSRINCILLRHKTDSLRYRCHANVPFLVQDTSVMPGDRVLSVVFSAGKDSIYTNMADSTMAAKSLRMFNRMVSSAGYSEIVSRLLLALWALLFIS